jgi:hypothetical protein
MVNDPGDYQMVELPRTCIGFKTKNVDSTRTVLGVRELAAVTGLANR